VSWNYTENMFALDHARYPQFRFIASESACNIRYGGRLPSWCEIDTEYVIGHYYWSAYDYLGESAKPTKVWSRALIDVSGWVTPLGRYYQSCYSSTPVVHIMVEETDPAQWARFSETENDRWRWYPMVDHWSWGDRKQAKLMTFTNAEEVELVLNDRSLGRQKLADCRGRIMSWEVPYEPGTLKAIARSGGAVVAEHALTTAGEAVGLRLTAHKPTMVADGLDIVCVEAALVDAVGRLVPLSGRPVAFRVEGPATNAGVANGDIASDERWQGEVRSTWNGRCIALVRAGRASGAAVVTAAVEGLPPSQCRIPVAAPMHA
jgi:beta-galactosidase